jgi:two-component system, cell cycle response regulator DivK
MRPATILVVEDNALNLKLVRDVLQYAGYRVVEATTGEEGVRLAAEVHPDLVLTDLLLRASTGPRRCGCSAGRGRSRCRWSR